MNTPSKQEYFNFILYIQNYVKPPHAMSNLEPFVPPSHMVYTDLPCHDVMIWCCCCDVILLLYLDAAIMLSVCYAFCCVLCHNVDVFCAVLMCFVWCLDHILVLLSILRRSSSAFLRSSFSSLSALRSSCCDGGCYSYYRFLSHGAITAPIFDILGMLMLHPLNPCNDMVVSVLSQHLAWFSTAHI